MGSQAKTLHHQELDQLLEAYASIKDDHVRYFFSMMLQSVASALTEAQQDKMPTAKVREKQRAHLAA